MAAESLSELYLRLGLNYDDLQSDFISAEHTVQTNMGRLARENTSIRLQMEIDLQGLDEATDAQRIFEIRQRALNQQIANQRDRLNLANAALANARDRTGEYSNQTQRARIALEREQLALQHLEEELNRLNETQNESSENVGNFLDGFQDIAGRAAPYVAGITAIAGALQTAADASVALIEKFRELQKQAYDLNMPFDKAKNFLRQIKLGGGDYGDFQGYIRGITDAYVKGEVDDPEFIALSKYGAKITDATGKLKDFQAITEEVYQAYKKAKAEGSEIEFLQLTGGESGITDAIQFFERYEEAKEDAAKIFDSGINPNELHQAERSLNLLTEQVGEFKDALADVITPASKAAMDSLFETFRTGTEFIAENKKEIQSWGFIASEVFSNFFNQESLLSKSFSKLAEKFGDIKLDFGDETQNNDWQKFLKGIDEQNKNTFHNDLLDLAYGGVIERATEKQLEYNNAVKGATASWADFKKETEQLDNVNPLSQYEITRIKQFKDELDDLRIELDFGDDEYGKAKAQLDLWRDRELTDKLNVSLEEETAIRELYAARDEQIEKNRLQKIEELRNQYSNLRQTDLAKQLADIDSEMDSWIKSGMNSDDALEIAERRKIEVVSKLKEEFAASTNSIHKSELESRLAQIETERQAWIQKGIDEFEATRAAEQQKANAIKQLNDEWVQHVNSIHQTALENRLAQIETERQAWIQKGIDEFEATRAAEQQKVDARRNAAMEIIKSQLEEFQIYQQGGYKALKAYKLHDLIETTGVGPNLLNSLTPQQVEEFQKAQLIAERSLLPNFMTEQDKLNQFNFIQNKQVSELERILGGMSINGETPNIDISAGLNEGLTVFSTNIDAASSELSNLSQPISDFSTNIGTASEELYSLSNEGLSVFSSNIETASDGLFDLSQPILDVTEKLQDLSDIVYELSNMPSNQNNNQSNTTSPTVNVTVQIEEAHAWDTEHIQELADKVADQIEPAVVNAIGGDSNSY